VASSLYDLWEGRPQGLPCHVLHLNSSLAVVCSNDLCGSLPWMQCSPEVLAQLGRDNSFAGGKNCCLLLLEEANFNGYCLIRRTLGWITALVVIFAVCLLSGVCGSLLWLLFLAIQCPALPTSHRKWFTVAIR